jgi:acyl-CoA reductase-like NAD-dependent aldehyde dehydrogenase
LGRASAGHAPRGVVAVISSGSAPFAAPLTQIAAALLGGNGVLVKPAPRACLAGERVAGVLVRAGLPEGLVRVVHGAGDVGAALAQTPGIAHVFFAGSGASAGDVAAVCARRGASVTLDVNSGEAMLVLADAGLAGAVAGALWAACTGAGQLHGALRRVYVERALHRPFVEELTAAAAALRVGDPREHATQLGPLADASRGERLDAVVEQALAHGAHHHHGGPTAPNGLAGAFRSPTILEGSSEALALLEEPLAGPLLGVTAVADSVEAVALAGGARGASVWTGDRRRAARIARELAAPIVWCNDHIPGPGLRQSAADALATCVMAKLIAWDPPAARPPWRYPYDATSEQALRALATLHSTRSGDRERALRAGGASLARVAGRLLRERRR